MNRKKQLKVVLTLGLFFVAMYGWILHLRLHPPAADEDNLLPFLFGILSVFVVPAMFWFRRTLAYAYVINGFSVIIGTIVMAHYSLAGLKGPVTFKSIVMNTLFGSIVLLWGKFALGKALFDLQLLRSDTDAVPQGRFFRYPNMGWWWVHLIALTVVYVLGNILWK